MERRLAAILAGRHLGHIESSEITMYKSLGINAQDLASAYYLYRRAKEQNIGTWIDL